MTLFITQPAGITVARQALDLYPQGFGSFFAGMTYFRMFDSFSDTPQFYYPDLTTTGAPWKDTPSGTVKIDCGPGGSCLTGTTTTGGFGLANNNVFQPIISGGGTVLAYARANFSPTDSVQHILFNVGSSINFYALNKAASNTWKLGWFGNSGTEYRASVASSGTYTSGDTFVVGGTYVTGTKNQTIWVKGKKIAADNTGGGNVNIVGQAVTGAGNAFNIGNSSTNSPPTYDTVSWWQTSAGSQIYWIAFWDVPLSDDVISYISANPTSWMTIPDYFQVPIDPSLLRAGSLAYAKAVNRAANW